jgi:hypothetical protein
MPSMADEKSPVSFGLRHGNKSYIAVWRLKGKSKVELQNINAASAKLLYPTDLGIKVIKINNSIEFNFPDHYMAAIIEVTQ